eukprot:scaffold10503_cov19-Tisochrysis_lutea.AAC.1
MAVVGSMSEACCSACAAGGLGHVMQAAGRVVIHKSWMAVIWCVSEGTCNAGCRGCYSAGAAGG